MTPLILSFFFLAAEPVRPWTDTEANLPYGLPPIRESQVLLEATTARPQDLSEATLSLRFLALREHPELSGPGEVTVQLRRREGIWETTTTQVSADYNQRSQNEATVEEWVWEEDNTAFRGTLSIVIGPDSPRPRVTGIPNPPDAFTLEVEGRIAPDEVLPYLPMREASMAPWRVQTPTFSGYLVQGTYRGTLHEEAVAGALTGSLSPAPAPGRIGVTGLMAIDPQQGAEGLHLIAQLPDRRVASHYGASAVYQLGEDDPRNWEAWDGLRLTVSSPRTIPNAGISLSIREANGVSYHVNQAAPLNGQTVTTVIPFQDFRGGTGGTYFLDLDDVAALSIGVENPFGIGSVPFRLDRVELVRWGEGYAAHRREPVTLQLNPQTVVAQEGAEEVPPGLFGFHMVGGIRAPREGEVPAEEHVASLNPGLLRPLTHTGFNPSRRLSDEEVAARLEARIEEIPTSAEFRLAEAGNARELVIWCHTQDLWNRPSWMNTGVEPLLENIFHYYRNLASNAWTPGDAYNLRRAFEVWNEPFMWGRHFNMGHRQPPHQRAWEDPTQYGYIPAAKGTSIYAQIFNAAARGARSANPHVTLGGPSSPSFNGDAFGVLEDHVLPFVRESIAYVDFITEHHYGGYRQSFAASFDVLSAYLDTRYGKRLPIINTETNDLGGNSLDKAHYNIEDILASIMAAPDRNLGRSLHALWDGYLRDIGEVHAYQLMSRLRGQILDARSSDPAMMFLATRDREGAVVALIFNNSRQERLIHFPLPEGLALRENLLLTGADNLIPGETVADIEGMEVRRGSGDTLLRSLDPESLREDNIIHFSLPSRGALRLILEGDGESPRYTEQWEQHFADAVLVFLEPGQSLVTPVNWREGVSAPEDWAEVRLRLITTGVDRGEASVLLGETALPLPWSTSNFSDPVIQEIDLPRELWPHLDQLTFVVREEGNGFRLLNASIRTMTRQER